jgi:adenine-specific DNA-methyltransferase
MVTGKNISFVRYFDDFPVQPIHNLWTDIGGSVQSRSDPKIFVVQTGASVIQRCILMTTNPGDLVLDPTCGSGTTAYIAEQWGRRWITIDTSRVALALAKQRLLTASYDYYKLNDPDNGIQSGFVYETVPYIRPKVIANCSALDSVFSKWEPILKQKLNSLNSSLSQVTQEVRSKLQIKLANKERKEGKRSITDAELRRWLLPQEKWEEWEVPFDGDPDWPESLQQTLIDYRQAWWAKMDEVNATIAVSAPQEVLVDRPQVINNILRVSGPFTVESVQPLEQSLDFDSPIGGEPEELDTWQVSETAATYQVNTSQTDIDNDPINAEAHLAKIIRLLRLDGVRFPDNKTIKFNRLEPLPNSSTIHAEGEWETGGESRRVAVSIGPQYGPITALQVEDCLRFAYRRGYDDLVFAGFTIDGAAQAAIQEDQNDPNTPLRCHMAHINPDVNIGGDLLKDTPASQLFTVSGSPRVRLETDRRGEYIIHMEGVAHERSAPR